MTTLSTVSLTDIAGLKKLLDLVSRTSGYGAMSETYASVLSGYDHRTMGSAAPVHIEGDGLVFMTRPNMNLSYNNLAMERILTPLLTGADKTYQRAIRMMFDPLLGGTVGSPMGSNIMPGNQANLTSPLFDNRHAFMPLYSNGNLTLNGWPDTAMDTYTSAEGRIRENRSIGDGTSKNYSVFQLNGTWRNYGGDPITFATLVWLTYIDAVHQNRMVPYLENIMENRTDYDVRIFRFKMDPSRTRIVRHGSTMGVFPVGISTGAAFNRSMDQPTTHENQQEVSIGFQAHGFEIYDQLILEEFNDLVMMFNPQMADATRSQYFTKVGYQYLQDFNWHRQCFPWVNLATSELEWWVDTSQYTQHVANRTQLSTAAAVASPTSVASAPSISKAVTNMTKPDNNINPTNIGLAAALDEYADEAVTNGYELPYDAVAATQ